MNLNAYKWRLLKGRNYDSLPNNKSKVKETIARKYRQNVLTDKNIS